MTGGCLAIQRRQREKIFKLHGFSSVIEQKVAQRLAFRLARYVAYIGPEKGTHGIPSPKRLCAASIAMEE